MVQLFLSLPGRSEVSKEKENDIHSSEVGQFEGHGDAPVVQPPSLRRARAVPFVAVLSDVIGHY
jgi:hypothetical protein